MGIIKDYFDLYTKYTTQYKNVILLMQVGSFYEAYSTNTIGPNTKNISNILNIILTKKDKSKSLSYDNPHMIGFPVVSINKYLKLLIDADYTVVIFDQYDDKKKITRKLNGIYSPGTYIYDNNLQSIPSVFLMFIYIEEEKYNNTIIPCVGIALCDVTTGYNTIYEIIPETYDVSMAFDEINRYIISYNPKEIIINHYNKNKYNEKVFNELLELSNKYYNYIEHCYELPKICHQNEVLKKIFNIESLLSPIEYTNIDKLTYGRICYILMLYYITNHRENLLNKLKLPVIALQNDKLLLGNNAIEQLNILDKNGVISIINHTYTNMGYRYLINQLASPITNIDILNYRYDIINHFKTFTFNISNILKKIIDIERYQRKITLYTLHPFELSVLLDNYKLIRKFKKIINYKIIDDNCDKEMKILDFDFNKLKELINEIEYYFTLEKLKLYKIDEIEDKIINNNVDNSIDILYDKISVIKTQYIQFKEFIDRISINQSKLEIGYKDGSYVKITKKQYEKIQDKLGKFDYRVSFIGNDAKLILNTPLEELYDEFITKSKMIYIRIINDIYNKYEKVMDDICYYVTYIDFINSGAQCSIKNAYNMPIINNKYNNVSYIIANNIRHPIIEKIINTKYIGQKVLLGGDNNIGMILYGLNSSGKSSFVKSIGVNIILAQIGYYVAADDFEYYPFNNLYTRIKSNDDIYKGQSTFMIEMIELKNILQRCNNNSLILSDEITKGTEQFSGNIIVLTMLELLLKKQSKFILATHLHDIYDYDRFKKLKGIDIYHLHVEYNEIDNNLIFTRELRTGPGDKYYGLLFAKFIIDNNEFKQLAEEIKTEINNCQEYKTSRYNSNISISECYICHSKNQLETHHITPQRDSNINGIIGNSRHKNHISNLIVLCAKCHDKVDKTIFIDEYYLSNNGIKLDINTQ